MQVSDTRLDVLRHLWSTPPDEDMEIWFCRPIEGQHTGGPSCWCHPTLINRTAFTTPRQALAYIEQHDKPN